MDTTTRRYRKKPVVVEAIQYGPATCEEIHRMLGIPHVVYAGEPCGVGELIVQTIHGEEAVVRPGDYIVAEPEPGRFYPVRADIFAQTYEPATLQPENDR